MRTRIENELPGTNEKAHTCFVIMAGLPGTGKSTLARTLATQLRGVVLDKDLVRAALFPDPWVEYSREQDDFCVELLLQAGAYLAAKTTPPKFVFIDGRTFAMSYQIKRVAACAQGLGCKVKLIHLVCSDETARHRLARDHVAKNRDFTLYLKVKAAFEAIKRPHLLLNTDSGLTEILIRQSLQYLRGD
jgi:predicted kinase